MDHIVKQGPMSVLSTVYSVAPLTFFFLGSHGCLPVDLHVEQHIASQQIMSSSLNVRRQLYNVYHLFVHLLL